jgi:environmental stress-induced protein Ves
MKHWLGAADFKTMPWANGKGVTVELAREDRGGAMLWRLSRASVVENGPFSIFPGVDRVLTVLTGPGFDLQGPGTDLQARPFVPITFAGDVAVSAVGVTAPSDDFNVMTARALGRCDVTVLTAAGQIAAGGLHAVYWPQEARLLLTDEGYDFAGGGPAIRVRLPMGA